MATHPETNPRPDTMLTTAQAAEVLGLRPQTLHDWRCRDTGPPYLRLGGRAVRYRYGELIAWAEAGRVQPATRGGE